MTKQLKWKLLNQSDLEKKEEYDNALGHAKGNVVKPKSPDKTFVWGQKR
jgi:hypothetical protein